MPKSCCELPAGSNLNHCPACHQTFATLTDFDRHQEVDYDARPAVSCREAEALGLVRDSRGTWMTPERLRVRTQRRERLSQHRQAKAA